MKMFWIYRIALVLTATMLLASCAPVHAVVNNVSPVDGEIYAVKLGTTLWGMKQAVMEKPGTLLMIKDNLITFIWTVKDGWCFAVLNSSSQTAVEDFASIAGNGNMVNPKTMSGLVDWMRGNGWSVASASDVPAYIVSALSASASWLVGVAQNMTTFVLYPSNITPPEGAMKVWR